MTRIYLTQGETIAVVAEHTVMRNRADAALVSAVVLGDVVGEVAAQCVYVSAIRRPPLAPLVAETVARALHFGPPGMEH